MRNLMVTALVVCLGVLWATQRLGNADLRIAILRFLAARGVLQAVRFRALMNTTFRT